MRLLDTLINDIVIEIDYGLWKEQFNEETAEEPEFVEQRREAIEKILVTYVLDIMSSHSKADEVYKAADQLNIANY